MTLRQTVGWVIFAALMTLVVLPRVIARGYVELGSFYLAQKKYDKAEKAFLKARKIRDESCASCGLGMTYHRLGRHDDAENAFKRAITLNADDTCAYEQSGRMYYDVGEYPEAITAFKRAAALSSNSNTYMLLGNSYVYAREFPASVDAYKEAIRLNPKNGQAHIQLGIAYDYLDRRKEAVEEYRQAIKLNANDEEAHYYLALDYLALRNRSAALKEYEILRKINPDYVGETFEDFAVGQDREKGKEKLYFIPLNNFSADSLKRLVAYYKQKTGIDATATQPLPLRLAAIDNRRQQLVAEEIVELMKRSHPELVADPNAILIGLTDEDMYIRSKDWQFAFNYWTQNRFAVVSSARMNPINLGFAADSDLLESRMRKIILKDIGMLYYQWPTNHNPKSVLYEDVHGLKDLDVMSEDF